jgi:O-antigen/teichoic acid export membrane protein
MLGIVFVPLYLYYVGIEAYGLIGIFNSIIAFIVLLDFGLSPTINRELARLSTQSEHSQEMHDLKRTLESVNWALATFIAVLFVSLAPVIARYWIHPKDLSVGDVTQALFIMSVNIAIQFSINFYTGGLMGMQKQLLLNTINIVCSTLRFVGAFLVLALYSPTIKAFLIWQTGSLLLQLLLMALTLKFSLPEAEHKGRFHKELIRKIGRFAAGMTGITVVSLILTQTDKVILSKMLSLEMFGYYTLAVTMSSMSINVVINSISHAVYPEFSKFVAAGDDAGLRRFYHRCCQIASFCLFPIVVMFCLFSYDILLLWTRNVELAANTHTLLSIVAVGTGLNGVMWLPHYLQLAHGRTKLIFYVNVGAILVLIPLMIYGIYLYGAIGGALGWVLINGSYIVISAPLMHRTILNGELWRWYFSDLLLPLLGAIGVGIIGKLLLPDDQSRIALIVELGLIGLAAFVAAAVTTKAARDYFFMGRKLLRRT